MGFYGDRILPRLINAACDSKDLRPLRQRACAGLSGDVVEIGFGSGLNVECYPAAVHRVTAVDPSGLGWKLASKRVVASSIPIERSGLDGQSLPFGDGRFDTALTTWTLCSVPDAVGALQEIRRVLKPGGSLHFLEHGLAPDEDVRRWQYRLDPIQRRLAGGCSFTRPIAHLITEAGFTITAIETFYTTGEPKFAGAQSLGVAAA